MAAVNHELLVKCLELTKYVVENGIACDINVMMGEGSNAFTYNFRRTGHSKTLSPSQRKRNELRQQEFCRKKATEGCNNVKHESNVKSVNTDADLIPKKIEKKTVKFKVASHMCNAGKKVLENAVYRFNPKLSRTLTYVEDETKLNLKGDFSAEHTFSLKLEEYKLLEMVLEGIKENWRSDPFPARLVDTQIV